jgi:hypothetical protein
MKKQQFPLVIGKKLNGQDMKNVQGGVIIYGYGLWVCSVDYYECYQYRGQCLTYCSRPSACQWSQNCP